MRAAFEELAEGNFDSGLARLNKDNRWHDASDDLNGPFCLSFPGARGWGEELLAASLLKRHAANLAHGNGIQVFAHRAVCSILRNDSAFRVMNDQGDHGDDHH